MCYSTTLAPLTNLLKINKTKNITLQPDNVDTFINAKIALIQTLKFLRTIKQTISH